MTTPSVEEDQVIYRTGQQGFDTSCQMRVLTRKTVEAWQGFMLSLSFHAGTPISQTLVSVSFIDARPSPYSNDIVTISWPDFKLQLFLLVET